MEYDEGKGFLWNLYKGWNLGHDVGFKYANYVVPIATATIKLIFLDTYPI